MLTKPGENVFSFYTVFTPRLHRFYTGVYIGLYVGFTLVFTSAFVARLHPVRLRGEWAAVRAPSKDVDM